MQATTQDAYDAERSETGTTEAATDLRFRYVLADGVARSGFVRYTDDLPGDFDLDGDVDGSDFLSWQRNVGAGGTPTVGQGNADGDDDVDAADLAIWKSHFGFLRAVASINTIATPEPTSVALALAALTALRVIAVPTARDDSPHGRRHKKV